ncbi:TorD/DmsD family molecular chaperone [Haloterrigena alkaliphila]|uniref:Molecular chaperone TorD family protein n=1 Tax=Haloterrigena alkaliphila TaxID=2816475 RepID=A0A8A2VE59_9EURY|nr:molecular chaperone TorD family protein [Haloterrigena alkaliphila]QSW98704.1 molecular chaperone TorD family protein [Haloterrigena alkaliphila]
MADPEHHVHRARLYKLASMAFDRPTDDLREAMRSDEFDEQLVESAAALEDDRLRDHAETVAAESPDDADEIEDCYSRYAMLFGFEQGGEIQQYEVEYGPGTLVTSTDALADIAGFYGAFDLELEAGNRERVDHLCIELEFVSHLALQTAYLERTGDQAGVDVVTNAQADFLEDHPGRWLPRFRDTVHEGADDAFYRALADLVVALVEADADRFGVEPNVFPEEPPAPTEGLTGGGDGDFRCGTCGSNPSSAEGGRPPKQPRSGTQQFPMGDRDGPY